MNFVDLQQNDQTARVREADSDAIAAALFGRGPIEPVFLGGRGKLHRFALPTGCGLIRKFRRGGFIARFISDAYIGVNRPLRELELTRAAFAQGLPVPEPLGAVWEQRGVVYRGAIATVEIAGENLLQRLAKENADRPEILRRCGAAIRTCHDGGLYHADLQVENLMIAESEVILLDLDKATLGDPVSPEGRSRNLLRLARSMRKRGMSDDDFREVCVGYDDEALCDAVLSSSAFRAEPNNRPSLIECIDATREDELLRVINAPGTLLKPASRWSTRRAGDWVVKEFRGQGLAGNWSQLRDPHRVRRAWDVARYLCNHDLLVPPPLGYAERRRFGAVTWSAFVAAWMDGYVNVEVWAKDLNASGHAAACGDFLSRLADAVNQLEACGAVHHDLSGKNILTVDGHRFYFIDLDSVELHCHYSEASRLKNHVQLYDSFCDLWDDALLGDFIERMIPQHTTPGPWFERVRAGQKARRSRQETRWRKQGRRQDR